MAMSGKHANRRLRRLLRLETVGFCGLDDSADLVEVEQLSRHYSWIEWGVLLRPDLQGQPRYASEKFLKELGRLAGAAAATTKVADSDAVVGVVSPTIRLAIHLCGEACLQALRGDKDYVRSLHNQLGFRRMQLNPTEANAAGGWAVPEAAEGLRAVAAALPEVEIILQLNTETRKLFEHLVGGESGEVPSNLAVLLDPSCGTGVAPLKREMPPQASGLHCGYAGGFGPEHIVEQLDDVAVACAGYKQPVWIDMESSLRTKTDEGRDIFDLTRVQAVIQAVQKAGFVSSWTCFLL